MRKPDTMTKLRGVASLLNHPALDDLDGARLREVAGVMRRAAEAQPGDEREVTKRRLRAQAAALELLDYFSDEPAGLRRTHAPDFVDLGDERGLEEIAAERAAERAVVLGLIARQFWPLEQPRTGRPVNETARAAEAELKKLGLPRRARRVAVDKASLTSRRADWGPKSTSKRNDRGRKS